MTSSLFLTSFTSVSFFVSFLRVNLFIIFTIINIQREIIRKLIILFNNSPYLISAFLKVIFKLLKSIPPITTPITGINRSSTTEDTILLKALPITTPTAKSITFPLSINSLNSFIIFFMILLSKNIIIKSKYIVKKKRTNYIILFLLIFYF